MKSNKEIIRRFLLSMGEGHFDALADNAVFWVAGSMAFSGQYTKQEIKDSFAKFNSLTAEPFVVVPTAMIEEGNRVAVEAAAAVRLRDGRTFRNSYHYVFTLRDEMIVEVREYFDSAYVAEFFAAPVDASTGQAAGAPSSKSTETNSKGN
jgi:ketosteroid isomerase-like protein